MYYFSNTTKKLLTIIFSSDILLKLMYYYLYDTKNTRCIGENKTKRHSRDKNGTCTQ